MMLLGSTFRLSNWGGSVDRGCEIAATDAWSVGERRVEYNASRRREGR